MQRKNLQVSHILSGGGKPGFRLFLLLLLICAKSSFANLPQTLVNIQLIGPEQGLPSRNTRNLAQDGRGFMWVGTGQDLWRYDGYTFQNFTGVLTRSIGGSTLINQLRTGPDGKIWIAHNAGVSIVDPKTLSCTTIDPARNDEGLNLKQYLDIFFDSRQNAWVAIPGGKLIKVSSTRGHAVLFQPDSGIGHRYSVESVVTKLFSDSGNHVYAYIDGNFLHEVNEGSGTNRRIDLLGNLPSRLLQVASILQTAPGDVTIYYRQHGSEKGRMRKYSFAKKMFSPLQDADTPINPDSMGEDSKGHVWCKNEKEVGFLNRKTKEFTLLTSQLQQKTGAQIFFFASYLSSDGSYWISCANGLFKITLTGEIFKKYLSKPQEKPGDIGSSIRGITEDPTGKIWACSYGYMRRDTSYMLHQIDPVRGLTRHMLLHGKKNILGDDVIPYKVLFARGQVYAVTDGTQFLHIDPQREHYTQVEFPFVSGRGFTSFYKLNDHTFWMGTWGGMAAIDTRNLKPVLLNDKTGRYIQNERINYFMAWSDDHVLVSTVNGLYVLRQDATIVEHHGQTRGDKIRLPAIQIFHTVWHENALWAASAEGLIRIDTTRKKTRLFTINDGLPDNNIYAALPDERGNLWLSTNKGLSRFNTRTQKFHNYGLSDGLPHMEFNHSSYLKASDGTLYFGGLNGIVAVDPASVDSGPEQEHALQLISFSKFNADRNRTDTTINFEPGREIKFNPGDRLFTFSFMSPDYQNTAVNRFRYKLEGWNDDRWQMFGNGNKLLLNSLPPGKYKLRVQVSVAGAYWGAREWQARIDVAAPWYKSPWFFIFGILTIGFFFYLFYRYRLSQIMHIQQIRNGISADMHDEIGSTLSSISFYSQALLMQIEKAEHQLVVQKIKENAQQVQEGLSDIIWSVKAGNDEIEDVFARMFRFGNELSDSRGITFLFETDSQLQNMKLNMQTRKNLYLIFKEAINNAVKYAGCTTIDVRTDFQAGKVKMVIKDNGKGFDVESARPGNGLFNMQQRASQMNGHLTILPGKPTGTVITLIF